MQEDNQGEESTQGDARDTEGVDAGTEGQDGEEGEAGRASNGDESSEHSSMPRQEGTAQGSAMDLHMDDSAAESAAGRSGGTEGCQISPASLKRGSISPGRTSEARYADPVCACSRDSRLSCR